MKDLHDMLKKNTERVLAFINELFEEEEDYLDPTLLFYVKFLVPSNFDMEKITWSLLHLLELFY